VGHLLENGFEVETIETSDADLTALKASHGVGSELAGCHTALVDGYV
jgi:hypothetical protein